MPCPSHHPWVPLYSALNYDWLHSDLNDLLYSESVSRETPVYPTARWTDLRGNVFVNAFPSNGSACHNIINFSGSFSLLSDCQIHKYLLCQINLFYLRKSLSTGWNSRLRLCLCECLPHLPSSSSWNTYVHCNLAN
jgi:hypothetical protein